MGFFGGPEETRTPHLCNANAALYQMSYGPMEYGYGTRTFFICRGSKIPQIIHHAMIWCPEVLLVRLEVAWCALRELNPHRILRTDPLYPLS